MNESLQAIKPLFRYNRYISTANSLDPAQERLHYNELEMEGVISY